LAVGLGRSAIDNVKPFRPSTPAGRGPLAATIDLPGSVSVELVSVVFSFRNEAENIPELIARTKRAMEESQVRSELVFVNDCSNDGSGELLNRHAEQDKSIKIVNMARRCGTSPCVFAGFAHASGDAVIYMDSDLQDPPELISQMIGEWRKGCDVVNTTRLTRQGETRTKMWVTKLGYRIINLLSDTDIPMNTGDFKLLSRRVVNELLKLNEYDPFLRGLVRWVGFKQVTLYYDRHARHSGQTHFNWTSSSHTRAMISGITSFSSSPLYVSFIVGLFVSLGAFIYLVAIILTRLIWSMHLPGWPSEMVTVLFLGGLNLLSTGVLSMYVARISREVKRRPNWIVDSVVNLDAIKHNEPRSG
jgi:glycosyltransferase involved in cell wall biosynthesis